MKNTVNLNDTKTQPATCKPSPPSAETVLGWVQSSGVKCETLKEKTHHHNYSYSDDEKVWVKVTRTPNATFAESEHRTTTLLHKMGHAVPIALTEPQLSPDEQHVYTVWKYIPTLYLKWPGWTKERIDILWTAVKNLHTLPLDYAHKPIPEQLLTTLPQRLKNAHHLNGEIKKGLYETAEKLVERWNETVTSDMLKFSHGDVHPQNAIWSVNNECILIDWESTRKAPLEWDIACIYRNIMNSGQKNSDKLTQHFFHNIPNYCEKTFTTALYIKSLSHISYFIYLNKKDTKVEKTFTTLKNAIRNETINFPFPLKEYYK